MAQARSPGGEPPDSGEPGRPAKTDEPRSGEEAEDDMEERPIRTILDRVEEHASDEQIRVDDVLGSVSSRAFGPMMLVPGLVVVSPLGGLPGAPATMGITIALVSGQLVLGRSAPWLPKALRRRGVERESFHDARQLVAKYVEKAEAWVHPRLHWMFRRGGTRTIGALCLVLGLSFIPLELLPFVSLLPALAVCLLAVALVARDGLLGLLGCILAAFAFGTALDYWLS